MSDYNWLPKIEGDSFSVADWFANNYPYISVKRYNILDNVRNYYTGGIWFIGASKSYNIKCYWQRSESQSNIIIGAANLTGDFLFKNYSLGPETGTDVIMDSATGNLSGVISNISAQSTTALSNNYEDKFHYGWRASLSSGSGGVIEWESNLVTYGLVSGDNYAHISVFDDGIWDTIPITYIPINSNLSGPAQANIGDEVEIDVSFPDGYKLKDATQGSGISVYYDNGYIDFTYDEATRKLRFTMPN